MGEETHKVFISYHHDDQDEVEEFVRTFDNERKVFIARALGMEQDIIDSDDTDYVMRRIRDLYLKDSTVTIVLIGKCTWARKYVDWEIQASLRHGEKVTPNGLLGIVLPSVERDEHIYAPNRLFINLKGKYHDEGYARWYRYPKKEDDLIIWIKDAFTTRISRVNLIENPRERFANNRTCP